MCTLNRNSIANYSHLRLNIEISPSHSKRTMNSNQPYKTDKTETKRQFYVVDSDAYNEARLTATPSASQRAALQLHETCLKSHIHPRTHISQFAQNCRDQVMRLCECNDMHRASGTFLQALQALKRLRDIVIENPCMTMAILHHYSTLMLEWQTFQLTHKMVMPEITSHMKLSILQPDC